MDAALDGMEEVLTQMKGGPGAHARPGASEDCRASPR